jgi:hypothetical protein
LSGSGPAIGGNLQGPRRKRGLVKRLVLFSILLFLYFFVLFHNLSESNRRSLQLRNDSEAADRIVISVLVTGVNPATQELTAQIILQPQGALAQDEVTPAIDLKLLTNNVTTQQQFDFPKGKRMNRIEAVFPLNGELNKYPLDRYTTALWFLVTTPARKAQPKIAQQGAGQIPAGAEAQALQGDQLAVGTAELQRSTAVPLTITLSASTPGIKYTGSVSREASRKVTGVELRLRRADNVITVSVVVMTLMSGLALSLLAMVFKATTSGPKVDLVPLSLCISLIFGLPALRNIQPGVPAVGAFGDYVSFIWAEIIVGLSAIIIIWNWLVRFHEES